MDPIVSNPADTLDVWNTLEYARQSLIVILCITIAISIIFAVAAALPAAWHWYSTGSSDGQIAYPFFIGLTDNVCWITYGAYKRDWPIIAMNIYCISMTVFYIIVMYIYRKNRVDMNRLIFVWCIMLIIVQGTLSQQETNEDAAQLIGRFTVCIQTIGVTGLFYLFYKILKSRRLDFIPFFPVALGLTIETQVFTLGLLKQDRYLMLANGFFMVMNAVLFAFFYILPADRQLVIPDLFTFTYERCSDIHKWYWKRRLYKKAAIYRAKSASVIVDINANMI